MNESPFLDKTNLLLSRLETIYLEFYYYKNIFKNNCHHFLTKEENKEIEKEEQEENQRQDNKNHQKHEQESVKEEQKEKEQKEKEQKEKEQKEEEEDQKEEKQKTDLYKKLILHCHPDKKKNIDTSIFTHVQKAQAKFSKQCFLAKHLGIPITLTEEDKEEINKTIEKKRKKIEHLKKTYPVTYALASEDDRNKILNTYKNIKS